MTTTFQSNGPGPIFPDTLRPAARFRQWIVDCISQRSLVAWPFRPSRMAFRAVQLLLDGMALSVCFVLAYCLRFDFSFAPDVAGRMLSQIFLAVPLQLATLAILGTYSFVWRYVGLRELRTFATAAVASTERTDDLPTGASDGLPRFYGPAFGDPDERPPGFLAVAGLRVVRRIVHENSDRSARPKGHAPEPGAADWRRTGRADGSAGDRTPW